MQGEIIPSWNAVLIDKELHDGDTCNLALAQDKRVRADREARGIKLDISNHKAHACDKTKKSKERSWDLLLDNQSTCDVIMNLRMMSSIRRCRWTLRL